MSSRYSRRLTGRGLARQVLARVRRDDAFANLALSAALRRSPEMDPLERSLATEIVYGVLRNQRLLDHALGLHARQSLQGGDPEVLDALRVAAYQILMLDRVPAHAAVNDAVGAIRDARGSAVAGFANAVLRRLGPDDLTRDLPTDEIARLALECSLPDDLARRWADQLGVAETWALGRCLLGRSSLVARANTLKVDLPTLESTISREGGCAERCVLAPQALKLTRLPEPFAQPSYLDGLWTAQDEGAQLVAQLVAPERGEHLVDACAGVGGKSTHLAALMGDSGHVLCIDASPRKLELLREHCLRLGAQSCEAMEADFRRAAPSTRTADRVLLDAPCSGLGVLQRHPELKWRVGLGSLPGLVALQRELLFAAASWVRPGGVLVYSVCTTTEEEGPAQAKWIVSQRPELVLELISTASGFPLPDGAAGEQGMVQLWPHRHGTDGFFMARFRRRG